MKDIRLAMKRYTKSFALLASIAFVALILLTLIWRNQTIGSVSAFLNDTGTYVSEGKLDSNALEKFANTPLQTDASKHETLIRTTYINTVVDAVGLYSTHVNEGVTALAVNEPYEPSKPYIFVYIVPSSLRDMLKKLKLNCAARAFPSHRAIIIDELLLHAFSHGTLCNERTPLLWSHPELTVSAANHDPLFVGVLETREFSLRITPLIIIAHELAHLIIHSEGSSYPVTENVLHSGLSRYSVRESEADDLAIKLIVDSHANRGESVVRNITDQKYFEVADFLTGSFLHIKSFVGGNISILLEGSERCGPNQFLAHRIQSIMVSLTRFQYVHLNQDQHLREFANFEPFHMERLLELEKLLETCI